MPDAPRVDGLEPASDGARASWIALGVTLLAVLIVDHLRILPYLRTEAFHMDVWEMIARGYDPRGMLAAQLDEIEHWIRVRPVFQLSVPLWVRWRGLDGPGLALALWGVVIFVQLLTVWFLRTLGYGRPTAVLSAFMMLLSCGVLRTTFAHQYNDVTFAHFFTLLMLIAALRLPSNRSLFATLPLLVLAMLSHECGVMAGPLLVLCDGLRDGVRPALRRLMRPDRLLLLALCVAYAAFRFVKTPPTDHSLSGFRALTQNLKYLDSFTERVLLTDFRSVFLIAIAIVLVRSRALGKADLRNLAFGVAWLVTAYLPFLTNQNYQSATYLNLALVGPVVAVMDPVGRWLFRPGRAPRQQVVLPILTVLCLNHWNLPEDLSAYGRFVGPALSSVATRLPPGHERMDVWIVEDELTSNVWSRTRFQDDLDMYRPDESIAFTLTIPDREVRLHPIDAEALRFVQPRSDDVILRLTGTGETDQALWRLPNDGGEPELLHRSGPQLLRPEAFRPQPPPPGSSEAVGRFWADYAARKHTRESVQAIEALQGTASPLPWLRAIQAVFPKLLPPPEGMPAEPRAIRAG